MLGVAGPDDHLTFYASTPSCLAVPRSGTSSLTVQNRHTHREDAVKVAVRDVVTVTPPGYPLVHQLVRTGWRHAVYLDDPDFVLDTLVRGQQVRAG